MIEVDLENRDLVRDSVKYETYDEVNRYIADQIDSAHHRILDQVCYNLWTNVYEPIYEQVRDNIWVQVKYGDI